MDPFLSDVDSITQRTHDLSWDDLSCQLVEDPAKAARKSKSLLVGFLVSVRVQHKPAMKEAIRAAWRFAVDLRIADVGPYKFSFVFSDPSHKQKVLLQAPCNIRGFLLVLREWPPDGILSELQFSLAVYWIQIHGLPLARFSSLSARLIGSKLGRVLEVDPSAELDESAFEFLRVRMEVQFSQPLSLGFFFASAPGCSSWVSFKYERLLGLCYNCHYKKTDL